MKSIVIPVGFLFLAFTAQAGDQMPVVDLNTVKTLPGVAPSIPAQL